MAGLLLGEAHMAHIDHITYQYELGNKPVFIV